MRELQPVQRISGAKEAMADSGWLEVVCTLSVYKKGSKWQGAWEVFVVTPIAADEVPGVDPHLVVSKDEGQSFYRVPLVTWRTLQRKVITTVEGVASLAIEVNALNPELPLRSGDVARWTARPEEPTD